MFDLTASYKRGSAYILIGPLMAAIGTWRNSGFALHPASWIPLSRTGWGRSRDGHGAM